MARRVKQEAIRRLYDLDAKGIVDEELIDEVGYAMLARCESIEIATRAHSGRARCPRCRAEVHRSSDETRTAACNLIEGTLSQLVRFLDELAYGSRSTEGLKVAHDHWVSGVNESAWLRPMRRRPPESNEGGDGVNE